MTSARNLTVTILAVAATAGGLAAVVTASGAQETPRTPVALAQRLAAEPTVNRLAGDSYPSSRARDAASRLASRIPLPAGGTFNGIQWERLGGNVTDAEAEGMLEYNAACQWLRARRDGRDLASVDGVLAVVSAWPAVREDSGAILSQAAKEPGGDTAAAVLRDCDASHERETAYAAQLGLPPST